MFFSFARHTDHFNFSLSARRTVHDKMTGTDVRLSDEQVDLVQRLQQGKFGDVNFNEYEVTNHIL